jgi:hypothetical protein
MQMAKRPDTLPLMRGWLAAALAAALGTCLVAAAGAQSAARRTPRGAYPVRLELAEQPAVDLKSSVEALKQSHPAAVNQLPPTQRDYDRAVMAVIEKLPFVVQEAYLVTLQDYRTLEPAGQKRVNRLMESLASFPEGQQRRFVKTVTQTFQAVESDPEKLADARKKPHQTMFSCLEVVTRIKGTKPAPKPGQ